MTEHAGRSHALVLRREHAARYEAAFFADLAALGCRPPHAAPRVTDHIPEIVAFVRRIEERGFAYASGRGGDGAKSVYFDVAAFRRAGHTYGRLEPASVGSLELAAEGESDFGSRDKRSEQVRA